MSVATLKTARHSVAQVLIDQGWENAFQYSPEKFSPPLAYVLPGAPYLTPEGVPYGHHKVQHEVRIVVRPGANETQTDQLDQDIEMAVIGFLNAGFTVGDVSQPYSLMTENGAFTAVTIEVLQTIQLGE